LRAKNGTEVLKIDGFGISGSYGMKDATGNCDKIREI
jgi:hypothetical protein